MPAGKTYVTDQMYVEERVPARRTHPYPIVMVHGGTMSGVNFTGTPDGREGWAQYFVRQGYAVYVVDQPGRGRSGYLPATYGPGAQCREQQFLSRVSCRRKNRSSGRRRCCTRNGRARAIPTIRRRSN